MIFFRTGVVIFIMTALLFTSLMGCNQIDNKAIDVARPKLEEKYHTEFNAISIGNRMDYDTATIFFKDKEGIGFSANVNSDTGEVEDDYIRHIIDSYFENEINIKCEEFDVEAVPKAVILCDDCSSENNTDISVEEFKEKYNMNEVMVDVAVNSDVDTEKLESMVNSFSDVSKSHGVKIYTTVYSFDESDYIRCAKELLYYPTVSDAWFDGFNPVKKTEFNVEAE